ncbi:MAG TPA: hypothetical protein VNS57_10875 [Steroidobacteraceae bacterium]|nr:hypothetical protein [Steroidobacteraceae bacterium]
MKLRVQHELDLPAMRGITAAILRADLGSRINFEHDAQIVRVENWLTVAETVEAIVRGGYTVAAIVDASNDVYPGTPNDSERAACAVTTASSSQPVESAYSRRSRVAVTVTCGPVLQPSRPLNDCRS